MSDRSKNTIDMSRLNPLLCFYFVVCARWILVDCHFHKIKNEAHKFNQQHISQSPHMWLDFCEKAPYSICLVTHLYRFIYVTIILYRPKSKVKQKQNSMHSYKNYGLTRFWCCGIFLFRFFLFFLRFFFFLICFFSSKTGFREFVDQFFIYNWLNKILPT